MQTEKKQLFFFYSLHYFHQHRKKFFCGPVPTKRFPVIQSKNRIKLVM